VPLLLLLGYYLAVGTTRFGLDPDNQSVPLITGVMDLTGVAAVVLAVSLLGVPI
jgi:cation transporter-like permease